jgi:hypothetical protein
MRVAAVQSLLRKTSSEAQPDTSPPSINTAAGLAQLDHAFAHEMFGARDRTLSAL